MPTGTGNRKCCWCAIVVVVLYTSAQICVDLHLWTREFVFLFVVMCVCICMFSGGWDCWTENIPPSHSVRDPAASLPTAIYFFTTPTPITQTYTHAPTAPVAPPRLLWEEQGDPGSVRGEEGGCNQGRTCPGSAFWSSSRQGDISALTPTLEETAPGSVGGDGPPSFALR